MPPVGGWLFGWQEDPLGSQAGHGTGEARRPGLWVGHGDGGLPLRVDPQRPESAGVGPSWRGRTHPGPHGRLHTRVGGRGRGEGGAAFKSRGSRQGGSAWGGREGPRTNALRGGGGDDHHLWPSRVPMTPGCRLGERSQGVGWQPGPLGVLGRRDAIPLGQTLRDAGGGNVPGNGSSAG